MNRRFWDLTLNLPKTSLPLRYKAVDDVSLRENVCEAFYSALQAREHASNFQLIDGPPFANGNLHVGHALNKILKDVVLRVKALNGERVSFRPGWDCHGLPIEMKALSASQMNADPISIRALCRKFALEAVEKQAAVMKQWGLLADHANPYLTMNPEFEANQLNVLAAMLERQLIFSARKPVYYSPSSKTALAEAELEYDDNHISLALFVKFKANLNDSLRRSFVKSSDSVYFVAWTTTPWTLPSNQALAVGKDIVYSLVKSGNEFLIVAKERAASLCSLLQHSLQVIKEDFCLGSDLAASCRYEKLTFSFDSKRPSLSPILLGEFVTAESGTGIVHLAPNFGKDDFEACKAVGIPALESDSLSDAGDFNASAPGFLRGLDIFSGANETIIEYLKFSNNYLACSYHKHRYPIDWRTKQPVIQRATRQWFVSIDELRDDLKAAVENVTFIPDSGKQKMLNMLQSRSEWCISRQRHWGLPIPAFKTLDETEILRADWVRHFAGIVRHEGSDAWWKRPVGELIPAPSDTADASDASTLSKTFNTLDVWFDSGTVWSNFDNNAASKEILYLEGSDQFRGWFQSSLITSVAVTDRAPYTKIISHGFVLDQAGQKMSKSLGNVVDPQEIVKTEGSDVLRLWAASTNYANDVSIGPEIIKQTSENRRKLRNTLRFIVSNLEGYDGRQIDWNELRTLDRLVYAKLATLLQSCRLNYDSHTYQKVANELLSFCSEDLSSFYLDVLKDRLYTEHVSSPLRQSTQALLKIMAQSLVSILSPITPFLAQELKPHLDMGDFAWPVLEDVQFDAQLYNRIMSIRKQFLEAFNSSLRTQFNCKSTFALDVSVLGNLFIDEIELEEILQVALVQQVSEPIDSVPVIIDDHLQLFVRLRDRHKCPRCWTFNSKDSESICPKCQKQLPSIVLENLKLPNFVNKEAEA